MLLAETLPLSVWPNGNMETEFWVKEKKVGLLPCQAKGGSQQANALKTVLPLEGIRRWFYSLGVGETVPIKREWKTGLQIRIRVEASLRCLS